MILPLECVIQLLCWRRGISLNNANQWIGNKGQPIDYVGAFVLPLLSGYS